MRCPLIKQSEEDEQMVEDEIQDMLKKGIISKVPNSKWIFPFFVARSRTARRKAKARTAGDFRRLNKFLEFHDYPLPVPEELIDEIAGDSVYLSSLDINKAYHQIKGNDKEGV